MIQPGDKRYIGDGVYVTWDPHGSLILSTERETGEHFIFLGPNEMTALKEFEREVVEAANAERRKNADWEKRLANEHVEMSEAERLRRIVSDLNKE